MTERRPPSLRPDEVPPSERPALAAAIEEQEAHLRRMEAEHAAARARVLSLRARLAALDGARESASSILSPPRSSAEKVKLFRQLFRGRADLYPTRFVSKKTGKAGYAPACSNKFVVGVCDLPKVKCGECTRQAFRPVDDTAVLQHLQGKHVMGVYPMLPDETCWFLAATARGLGLPALVERSRSGNGAHVWFFFSSPVAAATARKIGCHLITETMASRHELSMDSYDRLFPSQDTTPRGGFGNLIALPLQHGPRQLGNSVFLDDNLNAYADERRSGMQNRRRTLSSSTTRCSVCLITNPQPTEVPTSTTPSGSSDAGWRRRVSSSVRVSEIYNYCDMLVEAPGIEPSTRKAASRSIWLKTGTSTPRGERRRTAGFRGVPSRAAESGHDVGHGRAAQTDPRPGLRNSPRSGTLGSA